MDDFASSEEHGSFYFVALLQKTGCMILLECVVMLIRVRAELHFLNSDVLLMLLRLVLLLVLLVEILSEVHNPANRRVRSWSDFDEI